MIDLPKKYSLSIKAALSLFGIGFFPFSPGTLASGIVSYLWYLILSTLQDQPLVLLPILLFISLIYFVSIKLISISLKPPIDKSWIVIDEFVGMVVALTPTIFLDPLPSVMIAFVTFRFFDIVKPLFIKSIDSLHTPESVMRDDLAAGLLSAASVILISLFY